MICNVYSHYTVTHHPPPPTFVFVFTSKSFDLIFKILSDDLSEIVGLYGEGMYFGEVIFTKTFPQAKF